MVLVTSKITWLAPSGGFLLESWSDALLLSATNVFHIYQTYFIPLAARTIDFQVDAALREMLRANSITYWKLFLPTDSTSRVTPNASVLTLCITIVCRNPALNRTWWHTVTTSGCFLQRETIFKMGCLLWRRLMNIGCRSSLRLDTLPPILAADTSIREPRRKTVVTSLFHHGQLMSLCHWSATTRPALLSSLGSHYEW